MSPYLILILREAAPEKKHPLFKALSKLVGGPAQIDFDTVVSPKMSFGGLISPLETS